MEDTKKYAIVTTVVQHRIRYAVSLDELQKLNTDDTVKVEWATDLVTCDELEEFSQDYIGETIVDLTVEDENQLITRFDKENSYLKDWTQDQKIEHISKLVKQEHHND